MKCVPCLDPDSNKTDDSEDSQGNLHTDWTLDNIKKVRDGIGFIYKRVLIV